MDFIGNLFSSIWIFVDHIMWMVIILVLAALITAMIMPLGRRQ